MKKLIIETKDLNLVKKIYSDCNYEMKSINHQEGDLYFIAKLNDKNVGVARLCIENGFQVMRGVNIMPNFQRNGLGKLLVKEIILNSHNRHNIWCLPYEHLIGSGFYESVGFELAKGNIPLHLLSRKENYFKQNIKTQIMVRKPTSLFI